MTSKQDPTQRDHTGSLSVRTGAYVRTRVVREYFLRHPGVQVWLIDLREEQITQKVYVNDNKIVQAINNTRNGGIMNIATLVRGQSWIYLPNKGDTVQPSDFNMTDVRPADPMMDVVKTIGKIQEQVEQTHNSERLYREKMITKSGDRILEDEDGVLFRAKELDL